MTKPFIYTLPLPIASDHAGFELKQQLISHKNRLLWKDLGCFSADKTDYPDWADKLCRSLQKNMLGVLVCGTGQGMAIKANRWKHIRASLCWNENMAFLSRSHNQSNVLCLPGRFLKLNQALSILEIFLQTRFKNTKDYQRRIQKLNGCPLSRA